MRSDITVLLALPLRRSTKIYLTMKAKEILYDIPVSNHGGRVRLVVKAKNLEEFIEVKSPQDVGYNKPFP